MGILGELWVKLGLKNEGLNKGLEQSKQKVSGFAQYVGKLGGIMAAAFSVKEIVAFTHRTAELANKAKGVRDAFNKLGDPTLLKSLRKATSGTVDDLQLMQRAVQAKNFKIPLDQLATYLQFATKRARETGQSVDYLVDSIITGLGRQSVMILDNLGISAAEIRDNMKGGASMAEAVGKIIKTQMGDAATEIDKAELATGRLSAAWTNFQLAVGDETKGPWNWVKNQLAGALEGATKILSSQNVAGWKKYLAALNPAKAVQMWIGGSFDKAFAKDEEDAAAAAAEAKALSPEEFTGPLPKEVKLKKSLIQELEKEIKAKEEIRNLSVNESEIRGLNNEIAALQERLKLLKMTSAELAEYNKKKQDEANERKKRERIEKYGTVEAVTSGVKTPRLWDAPSMFREGGRDSDKSFQKDMDAWRTRNEEIAAIALEQQQRIQDGAAMMTDAMSSGISAGLGELANLIAGVEGADAGQVVKALLSPLADAAISAGLLIMTTGEGIEALKSSLVGFFGGNAIVAGAALMAVGLAAKAGLAAIGRGNTGGGYGGMQSVTSFSGGQQIGVNTSNYAQQTSNINLTSTLKGQDILLSVQRTENNNKR